MSLPSVELLESRHSFPCRYMFKVIGFADNNFTGRVVASVRDELRLDVDPPFTLRSTKRGDHVSITLEPQCGSPQQVIAVYSRLMGMDGIVMLL
ncbi:MAG: DUF493 domain-containing protein [Planctomycetaceae bacterium]|nr:DUF493 domain-containing protein [Planctomycetaceae bacterium]